MKLTLFFDGQCPLCADEMQQLADLDHQQSLNLIDLNQADFEKLYPHVDKTQAMKILQAQQADGSMLYGLDANCKAWEIVGKRRWMRVLRWPLVRVFADVGYLLFAKYRPFISHLATGQERCMSCEIKSKESEKFGAQP